MGLFSCFRSRRFTPRAFRGIEDARLYAVGDVHGRLDLLDRLLALIARDLDERPSAQVFLAFLGDLIDRGPESARVIERLRQFDDFRAMRVFLMGNHEEVFLRVLEGEPGLAYSWLGFGGDACAASYGLDPHQLEQLDEAGIAERLNAAVPAEHVAFLRRFGDFFAFGDYLLVHAGIRPGVPLDQQDAHDMRWIRKPFLSSRKDHGTMIVHGHTISDGIDHRSNRIGVDTGAYRSGMLSALVVDGDQRRTLSTGQ